jgi:hypothetical protein
MEDAPDFEGIGDVDKEKPVVGDAEPEFVAPLKRFHVAFADAGEAIQRGENAHGSLAVDAAPSALAGSVQTIRFTAVPGSYRSLPA